MTMRNADLGKLPQDRFARLLSCVQRRLGGPMWYCQGLHFSKMVPFLHWSFSGVVHHGQKRYMVGESVHRNPPRTRCSGTNNACNHKVVDKYPDCNSRKPDSRRPCHRPPADTSI